MSHGFPLHCNLWEIPPHGKLPYSVWLTCACSAACRRLLRLNELLTRETTWNHIPWAWTDDNYVPELVFCPIPRTPGQYRVWLMWRDLKSHLQGAKLLRQLRQTRVAADCPSMSPDLKSMINICNSALLDNNYLSYLSTNIQANP